MIIFASGKSKIEHVETGQTFEIGVSSLDWDCIDSPLSPAVNYIARVDHADLGPLQWKIVENPEGFEESTEVDVGDHFLLEDFEFGLQEDDGISADEIPGLPERLRDDRIWAKSLTRSTLLEYICDWFYYFYEDPANETPYNGREGGYLYLKGGPYSAEEELRESFDGVVPEDAIKSAVERIQAEGFEWAPSPRHPDSRSFYDEAESERFDYDEFSLQELAAIVASETPGNLGEPEERASRVELIAKIEALQEELGKLQQRPAAHGGIGHNQPPEEFEFPQEHVDAASDSLEVIVAELKSKAPNLEMVVQKASALKSVVSWSAKKAEMSVSEFLKSFSGTLGKGIAGAVVLDVVGVLDGLKDWLFLLFGG